MTSRFQIVYNLRLVWRDGTWLTSSWDSKDVGTTKGLDSALLSHVQFLLLHMFLCLPCLLSFFLSRPPVPISAYVALYLQPPLPFCPSTSLCSGDSPEQRSAATWQWASPVLSLSGDHQWDLHPCACATLAGGLHQSHTHHYGVCVASPIHMHLSSPSFTVFLLSVWSIFAVTSKMLRFILTMCDFWSFPLLLF